MHSGAPCCSSPSLALLLKTGKGSKQSNAGSRGGVQPPTLCSPQLQNHTWHRRTALPQCSSWEHGCITFVLLCFALERRIPPTVLSSPCHTAGPGDIGDNATHRWGSTVGAWGEHDGDSAMGRRNGTAQWGHGDGTVGMAQWGRRNGAMGMVQWGRRNGGGTMGILGWHSGDGTMDLVQWGHGDSAMGMARWGYWDGTMGTWGWHNGDSIGTSLGWVGAAGAHCSVTRVGPLVLTVALSLHPEELKPLEMRPHCPRCARGEAAAFFISQDSLKFRKREREKRGEGERGGTEQRAQRPYRMTMEGNALSNLESQPCPGNTEGEKKLAEEKRVQLPRFLPWQQPSSPIPSLQTQCEPKAAGSNTFFFH